ncbi:MAG TPA: 2-phospho-L-lactate guanylyltransferase [Micropepsaceae bacterium]
MKSFAQSKTRLAAHFSPQARAALAAALCADFFAMIAGVARANRVFVVSREPQALERARALGWETIVETEQISESHSVDAASRICAAQGVSALLRIPMDLPLVTAADIDEILAEAANAPSCVIVPSFDGTGTNALLRSPPSLFASHFGPDSFARHLEEAERCGARVKILHNAHIARDVDEWDDLRALLGHTRASSETARWISQHLT